MALLLVLLDSINGSTLSSCLKTHMHLLNKIQTGFEDSQGM